MQIILCKHGHICPWTETRLAACTDKLGPVAGKLRKIKGSKVEQLGSDGANISFPLDQFDAVAEIMHPRIRRHRHISEEERKRLASIGFKKRPGAHPTSLTEPHAAREAE